MHNTEENPPCKVCYYKYTWHRQGVISTNLSIGNDLIVASLAWFLRGFFLQKVSSGLKTETLQPVSVFLAASSEACTWCQILALGPWSHCRVKRPRKPHFLKSWKIVFSHDLQYMIQIQNVLLKHSWNQDCNEWKFYCTTLWVIRFHPGVIIKTCTCFDVKTSILIGVPQLTQSVHPYLHITEGGSPTRLVDICSMMWSFVLFL